MSKKLKISTLLVLEAEIESMLGEELSIPAKYHLTELKKSVGRQTESAKEVRDEIIKKSGTKKPDGTFELRMKLEDGSENPAWTDFSTEFEKILEEEKELKYKPVPLELFANLVTPKKYAEIFEFMEPKEA